MGEVALKKSSEGMGRKRQARQAGGQTERHTNRNMRAAFATILHEPTLIQNH